MYGVLQSGLSVPVAWLFCSGMQWSDPRCQALDEMHAILSLPPNAVQTNDDVAAVLELVFDHAAYLYAEEILQIVDFCAHRQSQLMAPEHFVVDEEALCQIAAQ